MKGKIDFLDSLVLPGCCMWARQVPVAGDSHATKRSRSEDKPWAGVQEKEVSREHVVAQDLLHMS